VRDLDRGGKIQISSLGTRPGRFYQGPSFNLLAAPNANQMYEQDHRRQPHRSRRIAIQLCSKQCVAFSGNTTPAARGLWSFIQGFGTGNVSHNESLRSADVPATRMGLSSIMCLPEQSSILPLLKPRIKLHETVADVAVFLPSSLSAQQSNVSLVHGSSGRTCWPYHKIAASPRSSIKWHLR
jgi:hypothetical protein